MRARPIAVLAMAPALTPDLFSPAHHARLATLAELPDPQPLTRFDESTRYVDYPSWSPDGRQVYFSMTRKVGDLFLLENR